MFVVNDVPAISWDRIVMKIKSFLSLLVICFFPPPLAYESPASTLMAQASAGRQPRDSGQAPTIESPRYLDYATFKALIELVPEAPGARLMAGLTDEAYELWSKGQMRVPAANYFVEGDFDSNGRPDSALLLKSGERRYLLIATREGGRWTRSRLFTLQNESQLSWDGKVLKLESSEAFIDTTGKEYSLKRGPLESYTHSYSVSDFAGVMIKFSHRPNAFEALLTSEQSVSLLEAAAHNVERENPAAARLLREYLKLFVG